MNQQSSARSGTRSRVLEHTVYGITQALERGLFAEGLSQRAGLFQSLDARVKVVSILALLIGVSLSRSISVILAIYALVLVLSSLSAIPAGLMLVRVWLALPFFTGLIVLPALFITPGPHLFELPLGLAITRTGAISALFLLLRVSTSLSLSMLLILTTPWNAVLSALGVLRVPDVFVLILGMTYRYIYLLLRVANDMFLSRQSRAVGRLSMAENQRMLAAIGATLLGKSLSLSSEVYLAMQSRGFRGSIITLKPLEMHTRDWLWLSGFAVLAAAFIVLGH